MTTDYIITSCGCRWVRSPRGITVVYASERCDIHSVGDELILPEPEAK